MPCRYSNSLTFWLFKLILNDFQKRKFQFNIFGSTALSIVKKIGERFSILAEKSRISIDKDANFSVLIFVFLKLRSILVEKMMKNWLSCISGTIFSQVQTDFQ